MQTAPKSLESTLSFKFCAGPKYIRACGTSRPNLKIAHEIAADDMDLWRLTYQPACIELSVVVVKSLDV